MADSPDSLTLEMGYTAKEFGKVLNGGFSGAESGLICTKLVENSWRIEMTSVADATLQLTIQQNPPRRLASLEIPVLLVDFHFSGFSSTQKKTFWGRFNRYFHKGGG